MNFKELAEKRFSARKYTDEPVSKADIDYIMECTRLAPSAHNLQPWKFLLLTSEESKRKIRQCYDRRWFTTAPMYVLAMKDTAGCWVRPDDVEAVRRLFPVEGYEAVAIMPVGHVAADCPCPKKTRKDMTEIAEQL